MSVRRIVTAFLLVTGVISIVVITLVSSGQSGSSVVISGRFYKFDVVAVDARLGLTNVFAARQSMRTGRCHTLAETPGPEGLST